MYFRYFTNCIFYLNKVKLLQGFLIASRSPKFNLVGKVLARGSSKVRSSLTISDLCLCQFDSCSITVSIKTIQLTF